VFAIAKRPVRSILRSRLEARRAELEGALLAKAVAVADPHVAADPAYAEGLRSAVSAALDYGLERVESGALEDSQIPLELLAQARIAARNGIDLDVVLRRYLAGYSALTSFVIDEAAREDLMSKADLQRMVATQFSHFDRLLAAIADEHKRESHARGSSFSERRAALVRALLAGDPAETAELDYDLAVWHVGFVAAGPGAAEHLRELAKRLDRRFLVVSNPEGSVWAWHGSRQRPDPAALTDGLKSVGSERLVVSVGEPASGEAGWRLTHRQAATAFPIALRLGKTLVRYADVGLVASIVRDDTLIQSLHALYVRPWSDERDAETLRETLLAYFAAEQNVSSAAVSLGVKRHTVTRRLRRIEERLARSLGECSVEVATALRVEAVAYMANRKMADRPLWTNEGGTP
jgi:hypothetical protein